MARELAIALTSSRGFALISWDPGRHPLERREGMPRRLDVLRPIFSLGWESGLRRRSPGEASKVNIPRLGRA